jgi:hypothetical protein
MSTHECNEWKAPAIISYQRPGMPWRLAALRTLPFSAMAKKLGQAEAMHHNGLLKGGGRRRRICWWRKVQPCRQGCRSLIIQFMVLHGTTEDMYKQTFCSCERVWLIYETWFLGWYSSAYLEPAHVTHSHRDCIELLVHLGFRQLAWAV